MEVEKKIDKPTPIDANREASIYTKKSDIITPSNQNSKNSTTTKKTTHPTGNSANKKVPNKDTIYCCIEGCKNICWTKRLASNLKNHWDLKEGGKYICGTHYNKDKKQRLNNTTSTSNTTPTASSTSSSSNKTTQKVPIKKRKIPEKEENHKNEFSAKSVGVSSSSSSPNKKKNLPIPPKNKKHKKEPNPTSQVRGVVVYKDIVQKENAIGEVNPKFTLFFHSFFFFFAKNISQIIIFPNTTIEQLKDSICNELYQELPFDIKRCHIPILPSQYQKLAFLFFSDRVEDSLVIVPPTLREEFPQNRENLLGLLKSAVDFQN